MISNYSGKIFKLPFPFSDISAEKARPALALSEPDSFGDLEFLLITTSQTRSTAATFSIPPGLLPHEAHLHLDQVIRLHKDIIKKELATIPHTFFEEVLRERILIKTCQFYRKIHQPKNNKPFIAGSSRINYGGRIYDEKEMANLVDSSLDFWLTTGPYAERFEKDFAQFLGLKHCSLVNSGSSANLLAFMALTSPKLGERRVMRGDEIITVAAGFPTTVAPIIQYGAVPVFVDVTLPTYNIDCSQLEAALSAKTKAVMVAHTLGNPFDITTVKAFCDKNNLWLIEDNCDALGSKYFYQGQWRQTGTIGDIGTSSFYPPHHMTMGEGGAVYTNDSRLKRLIESFRDWGRDCWCPSGRDNSCKRRFTQQFGKLPKGYDHKYVYSHFGYNLKVTDMQAAIGCAQLDKLPEFTSARRANWQKLRDGLTGLGDKLILPEATKDSHPSWFGFPLTLKENSGTSREAIVNFLEENGIQTRMLFSGNLIKHPCFDDMRGNSSGYRVIGDLENTNLIMNNTFWLGVYPGLTDQIINYMVKTLWLFFKTNNGMTRSLTDSPA